MGKGLLYIAAAMVLSAGSTALAERMPIRNFRKVSEGIYRGARPGEAGIAALSRMGVKTLVNLEDNEKARREELKIAKRYGLKVVSVPVDVDSYPSDQTIERALEAMDQASNQPVFIHCMHGEDRTGLVVGLYRNGYQNWSAREAWNEMLQLGFHPRYKHLVRYFEDATGFRAP